MSFITPVDDAAPLSGGRTPEKMRKCPLRTDGARPVGRDAPRPSHDRRVSGSRQTLFTTQEVSLHTSIKPPPSVVSGRH